MHSLVVVCRKHANGVFTLGRPATQKGATQDGGPEGRNFRLQRKHSLRDFLQQRAVKMSVWLKPCGLEWSPSGGLRDRSAQKKRRRRDSASSQH